VEELRIFDIMKLIFPRFFVMLFVFVFMKGGGKDVAYLMHERLRNTCICRGKGNQCGICH
jgi:hypothetical protein